MKFEVKNSPKIISILRSILAYNSYIARKKLDRISVHLYWEDIEDYPRGLNCKGAKVAQNIACK